MLRKKKIYGNGGLGLGYGGLGIGDWGLGPIPNPQSPIPNPHFIYHKHENLLAPIKKNKI